MNYTSNQNGDIFAITGLPEEVIAVLFAYYSRSPGSLRENLARLLADGDIEAPTAGPVHAFASEKARAFHEKWTVGYGHASVAEHAVVHLAVENVSILAAKAIEDSRLASYTEKSTRYVVFDRDAFVVPDELCGGRRDRYVAACRGLFDAYLDLMPKVCAALRAQVPDATETAVRGRACDLLRGLLPASTKTNLGVTANARALETMLSKLLGHPLVEVSRVGHEMHEAALTVVPTLVKYVTPSDYRSGLGPFITPWSIPSGRTGWPGCRLTRYDEDALQSVSDALTFDGDRSSADHLHTVKSSVAKRGPRDPLPRAFEASSLTFMMVVDYGAYRDLQRHRMLSPFVQPLGCNLGYDVPAELDALGFGNRYRGAIGLAAEVWRDIVKVDPLVAQYVVPLCFRVRVRWTLNLRELAHVIELRSGKRGHPSYRRIAQDLYREAVAVHPWLRDMIRVDLSGCSIAPEGT